MGRSISSVRMGVKRIAERWERTAKAMKKEDRVYAIKLAGLVKKHSSEVFYTFDDPLEAAVFSVLIELVKELDGDVDTGLLTFQKQRRSLD
ncbi:MAG: hypothetical protein H0Z19_04230 [Archaeoglobus sp.]|uniref:hypothetical protein n=1 Tax=Archaeoglobus sp. TaxID=1872626 RepID=UPI001D6D58FB|nr:hypothetical protein [Archaeoglobus sp.]MBO8179675.1 hypothetical protein [Archaeoglobus sp.]